MVAVTSEWGRQDLISHFVLPPDRVVVVPLAPAIAAYAAPSAEETDAVRAKYGIPQSFALYPAQTWPHKNHIRLVEALAKLRTGGVDVPLVCSGGQNSHFSNIQEAIAAAGVGDLVTFVGFVEPQELAALYSMARCVVMPTLFEAAGGFGPIAESFASGVPVACSNVTSLPEQVGDAAVVFDPLDVSAIAAALKRVWEDSDLREHLVAAGRENISRFSWERTALTFRAHYRRIAGRELDDRDMEIIDNPAEF
jgi:glycosyltransferase involved in cell wall biosynthesis